MLALCEGANVHRAASPAANRPGIDRCWRMGHGTQRGLWPLRGGGRARAVADLAGQHAITPEHVGVAI